MSRFVGPLRPEDLPKLRAVVPQVPPAGYHYAASGQRAIGLLVDSLKIAPGGRVALPPLICNVVVRALRSRGLVCDWVDIEPERYTMRFDREAFHRRRFDLILLPHHYGVPHPQTRELVEFAASEGVPLIHDAAQSHGIVQDGGSVIELSQGGFFSFGASKAATAASGALVYGLSDEVVERTRLNDWRRRDYHSAQFMRERAGLRPGPWFERMQRDTPRASVVQVQAAQYVSARLGEYNVARAENLRDLESLLGPDLHRGMSGQVAPYKWVGRGAFPLPALMAANPKVPQHPVPRPERDGELPVYDALREATEGLVEVSTERPWRTFR